MSEHEAVRCCGCDVQLCNDAACADWRHTGRPWIVDGIAWCDECSAGPRLAAALAEVDRLTARVAEMEKARAGDVARIVAYLRRDLDRLWSAMNDRRTTELGQMRIQGQREALAEAADAIERGDWRDAPLPPDPRDARIAALEAEVAGLRAVADTVTGGGST